MRSLPKIMKELEEQKIQLYDFFSGFTVKVQEMTPDEEVIEEEPEDQPEQPGVQDGPIKEAKKKRK